MKFVTAAEMRAIDQAAIRQYGIPSIVLMENAGIACADEAAKIAGTVLKLRTVSTIAIFCGKGNNGGDGLVAARHLSNQGFQSTVFYFQKPSDMKPDPLTNFRILEKMKVPLINCSENLDVIKITEVLKASKVVLDALFGTGLSKPVEGHMKTAIELMNHSKVPIVAVDIPSGLHADTGEVLGICAHAKVTVTLGLPKKSFTLPESRHFTGQVVVADISIPRDLLIS